MSSTSEDLLQSFIFENIDIRGAIITLDKSLKALFEAHGYDRNSQSLLAEFTAANVLLTLTLKFEGLLSLQARGNGNIALINSECNDKLEFRGIVQANSPVHNNNLEELFKDGTMAMTIEPKKGQRYQGIVPIENEALSDCLSGYFAQSEQLPSWFKFSYSNQRITGLFLQALPAQICTDPDQRSEDWDRLTHLAATATDAEMLNLNHQELLYRLYHEEQVRIFDPKAVKFQCTCSKERMERALLAVNPDEIRQILAEDGELKTQCHFCNKEYLFVSGEIQQLLQGGSA